LVKRLKFIEGNKIVAFPSGLCLCLLPPERHLLAKGGYGGEQEENDKKSDAEKTFSQKIQGYSPFAASNLQGETVTLSDST
jgi:hypothetical protein